MSTLVESLTRQMPLGSLRRVARFRARPVETQRRVLRGLLRRAAGTEWGRRYGFGELAAAPNVVEAYQRRVPLISYDDLREDVGRMRRGAPDVLWPGTAERFAVSSGTVSSGKVIPVSEEMLDYTRRFSIGTVVHYMAHEGNLRPLLGKHLTLPGRIEEDPNHPGTLVGEVSGLVADHAPGYFRRFFQAVPNEVAFQPNWDRKLEAIAQRTAGQDVRLLVMAPTWALVLFEHLIAAYNRRDGTRAETVGEVWPNLQLFISGGVALHSYRKLLEAQLGRSVDFLETYGASEGFFSFQNDLSDPAMLLHLDNGLFFEFVRMDALREAQPRRYTVADVEPQVRYALYVTSCSGLWSYSVGDVVRFTQTRPPKIVVAGRTGEMIDRYGEAVVGEEARAALRAACEATGAHMTNFHVAPRREAPGRLPALQWLVEFDAPPSDAGASARALDEYLQEVNRHYQIRREAQAFDGPEVTPLAPGTFYAWLRQEKEQISGQTKVPRMSEERRVAEGVLASATRLRETNRDPSP